MKKLIPSLIFLFILFGNTFPSDQNTTRKYFVRPLINKDYYTALREAIQSAKKSIKISMYVINREDSPSGPVNTILRDLVSAKTRGVKVKVIVECGGDASEKLFKENSASIEYLRENGIEADFDTPSKCLHEKFVLIDDRVAFIGAHNFSRAALLTSNETSIVVIAEPPDPSFAQHFSDIKIGKGAQTAEDRKKELSNLLDELLGQSKDK